MSKKLTQDIKRERFITIYKCLKEGKTYDEIAPLVGLGSSSIKSIRYLKDTYSTLRKEPIIRKMFDEIKTFEKPVRVSDHDEEGDEHSTCIFPIILELRSQGVSIPKIAKQLDIGERTVRAVLDGTFK